MLQTIDPSDPPPVSTTCFGILFLESQALAPDPFSSPARDARGRFALGRSGNPRGRPPGIPNPKRRLPNLADPRLTREALSAFLDRKPHLLRPLAAQVLPPARPIDPAERLGIDPSSLRTTEDFHRLLLTVWAALARGELTP